MRRAKSLGGVVTEAGKRLLRGTEREGVTGVRLPFCQGGISQAATAGFWQSPRSGVRPLHACQHLSSTASLSSTVPAADEDAEPYFSSSDSEDEPTEPPESFASLGPGESLRVEAAVGGRVVGLETGKLARLADGSCVVSVGGTYVLATAVSSYAQDTFHRNQDFLQLLVDYRERLYAIGRIPNTYTRQEGAPSTREVMSCRAIDRCLRPLFPPGYKHETQICANVLSADGEQDPDILAVNAASAALMCSEIPWGGPVGAVRVGRHQGCLVINPTPAQMEEADLNLTLAATSDRIVMLEGQGREVGEEVVEAAMALAWQEAQRLIEPQRQLAARAGKQKRRVRAAGVDPAALRVVASLARPLVQDLLRNADLGKAGRGRALHKAKMAVTDELKRRGAHRYRQQRIPGSGCANDADIDATFSALVAEGLRQLALQEGLRVDGRGLIDVRPLYAEVNTVPVVHGSALFQRGETQTLATVTVGGAEDQRKADTLLGRRPSQLMVHYGFPPYANNEIVRQLGGSSRREVGHSHLAERALVGVMPDISDFPFAVRLNAETVSSNGSSSMSAVCTGALALRDAGVPITSLVAGVSIGLLSERPAVGSSGDTEVYTSGSSSVGSSGSGGLGRWELIVDLQGLEDAVGDMDFKIAGTRAGITALHLDVKTGVPAEVLTAALPAARTARHRILDVMEAALPQERGQEAPQVGTVQVEEGMVGRLIGPQGATVRGLEDATGARVVIADGGAVRLFAPSAEQYQQALARINDITGGNIRAGERYRVRVVKLMDYGAFVRFDGTTTEALLHISQLAHDKIRSVEELLQLEQELEVVCKGRDSRGNIVISRKDLLPEPPRLAPFSREGRPAAFSRQ